MKPPEGHRERLREKFKENPQSLSDIERLELLLTYIIPRRDVAPLASELMGRFGSLPAVIAASPEELNEIAGVGESTTIFIQLLNSILVASPEAQIEMSPIEPNTPPQLNLFELEPKIETPVSIGYPAKKKPMGKERQMRVFANDEVANSLAFLPRVTNFQSIEDFKQFLSENLPYNAAETRNRRARNILERLYPNGKLDTPLTYFATNCSTPEDLKPVVFYHVLKAELIATRVANELIWPALPVGRVERSQITEFIWRAMPEVKQASVEKMLESLTHTYSLTSIATTDKNGFRFQLRKGTLESFLYTLTSEFPKPGMYSFEAIYSGPLHRWLLWDREWIRQQLYNLQDFGVLTKVSEIDTVKQFTLAVDQPMALRLFFEHPERNRKAIREQAESLASDQEK